MRRSRTSSRAGAEMLTTRRSDLGRSRKLPARGNKVSIATIASILVSRRRRSTSRRTSSSEARRSPPSRKSAGSARRSTSFHGLIVHDLPVERQGSSRALEPLHRTRPEPPPCVERCEVLLLASTSRVYFSEVYRRGKHAFEQDSPEPHFEEEW